MIGGGVAYDLILGWIPDKITGLTYNATPDSIVRFWYYGQLADENAVIVAGGGIYGWGIDGAVVSELTADTGFTPLEGDKTPRVEVLSPQPGKGFVKTSIADWATGTSYSTGQRSATAIGTIVRPPTHNGYAYELTTDTGSGTSEPTTWSTTIGGTSTDGGSNIWTTIKEITVNAGVFGITLGATLMTDGNTVILDAIKFDDVEDLGDIT